MKKKPISPFVTVLPQFLQELVLNLNCGVTLETAIKAIIGAHEDSEAFEPLITKYKSRQNGLAAFNEMASDADHQIIWRVAQMLNQFHITGSQMTVQSLDYLYKELWQFRHTQAKMKSERISTMMTFLLMLSFISVVIVIVAPILLTLG
nr:type II secretion system F family protein [Fusibacter paucivorans]